MLLGDMPDNELRVTTGVFHYFDPESVVANFISDVNTRWPDSLSFLHESHNHEVMNSVERILLRRQSLVRVLAANRPGDYSMN